MNKSNWKLETSFTPKEQCSFCEEWIEAGIPRYHNDDGEVMCEDCVKDN